jgi:hypothetical protein
MPRPKSPRKLGHSINLPEWWPIELAKRTKEMTAQQIADLLNAATHSTKYTQWSVYDYQRGTTTTIEMTMAFVAAFPGLPPPIIFATSPEQAQAFWMLAQQSAPQPNPNHSAAVPKALQTIEDTGDFDGVMNAEPEPAEPVAKPRKRRKIQVR